MFSCKSVTQAQQERAYTSIKTAAADTALVVTLTRAAMNVRLTKPDSALTLARKALVVSRRIQNKRYSVAALIAMGTVLIEGKNDFKQSWLMFLEARELSRDLSPDDKLLPTLYLAIGNTFYDRAMFDSAGHFYFKALQQLNRQKDGDTVNRILINTNLGRCFTHKKQYDQARYYLDRSLSLALHLKDTPSMAYVYSNIKEFYNYQNNTDSAIKYGLIALSFFLKMNHTYNAIETYAIVGQLFQDKKDFPAAERYYDSAMTLDRKEQKHATTLLVCLGKLNYERGNYRKAIHFFEQSLSYFDPKIHRETRLQVYAYLSQAYRQLNDYKQAYHYQNSFIELIGSMEREETDSTINQLEVKYRTSEKDKELATQKLQLATASNRLKNNQMWIIGSLSLSLILAISGITLYQKQRMQLQKAHISSQQLQMAQLKAAIDGEEKERGRIGRQLHDEIMVQLSVIKMGLDVVAVKYPGIKRAEEYNAILHQLNYTSQNIRQTAHNLMPDAILAEGLIPAVSYFCNDIMKLAQLRVHIQYYGAIVRLPADVEVNIYRIIQELIQNIIKHAKAKDALIQFNFRPDVLSITIEDDGVGYTPENNVQDNKMGLKSIRSRMKALDAHFDIHQRQPHGTSVNITLNL